MGSIARLQHHNIDIIGLREIRLKTDESPNALCLDLHQDESSF